jgi:hypothetical protein
VVGICCTRERGEKSVQGFGEGKRPLGRPRRKLEDGIRILGRLAGDVDWSRLAHDRDRW